MWKMLKKVMYRDCEGSPRGMCERKYKEVVEKSNNFIREGVKKIITFLVVFYY